MACSHQRELEDIEAIVRTNGGSGGEQANAVTGGNSAVGGMTADTLASDAVRLPPGVPVLRITTGEFTHYDQHDRSLTPTPITVVGQPFVLGQQFPFGSGDGISPGVAGYFGPLQSAVAAGSLLRTFFWMRCELPDPSINQCQSAAVFEKTVKPYTNGGLELPIRVDQAWTLFTQVFVARDAYDAQAAQLTFRIGYPNQILQLGAIGLQDYGNALTLEQLEALDQGPFVEVMQGATFASYGNAVQSQPVGPDYPFGTALNFTTVGQLFNLPEDSGLQGRNVTAVNANALMLASFWARCVQPDDVSGACRTSVVFEEGNSPYINAGLLSPAIAVHQDWQQYFVPFRAKSNYAPNEVKLGLRLGYPDQIIEFGPISLRAYDSTFNMSDMPASSLE